jgi:hypothetical protein
MKDNEILSLKDHQQGCCLYLVIASLNLMSLFQVSIAEQ